MIGPPAAGSARGAVARSDPAGAGLRVLQMNLCDSGLAGCYTGNSVREAAAVIREVAPSVVTVNEVCRDDVPLLEGAVAAGTVGSDGSATTSAFQAARDRRTGGNVLCRDGQDYGIGLIARRPRASVGFTSGVYPVQSPDEPEERAWLCLDAVGLEACTTHLDNSRPSVAKAQCDYLWHTVIPGIGAPPGTALVLGADLNLSAGGSPDVRSCLPAGYERVDDGGVQDVVTSGYEIGARRSIDMRATTDHPGLLVTLTATIDAGWAGPRRLG